MAGAQLANPREVQRGRVGGYSDGCRTRISRATRAVNRTTADKPVVSV